MNITDVTLHLYPAGEIGDIFGVAAYCISFREVDIKRGFPRESPALKQTVNFGPNDVKVYPFSLPKSPKITRSRWDDVLVSSIKSYKTRDNTYKGI